MFFLTYNMYNHFNINIILCWCSLIMMTSKKKKIDWPAPWNSSPLHGEKTKSRRTIRNMVIFSARLLLSIPVIRKYSIIYIRIIDQLVGITIRFLHRNTTEKLVNKYSCIILVYNIITNIFYLEKGWREKNYYVKLLQRNILIYIILTIRLLYDKCCRE